MNLLNKEFDLSFLNSQFENMTFHLFVSSDVNRFISCISCSCKDSIHVVENWTAIQNFISAYYQPDGDWAMWNIYLAFFCQGSVPLWEKYVIENDKYAVRKIVLDSLKSLPEIHQIASILNNQLLGADLKIGDSEKVEKKELAIFLKDHVRGTPLDATVESKASREERINKIIVVLDDHENKAG